MLARKWLGAAHQGNVGGNRAHMHSSKQMGGLCGAENLGRVAASWICPEKLGKRERMAAVDTEDLPAAPSPLAKLRLITEGVL